MFKSLSGSTLAAAVMLVLAAPLCAQPLTSTAFIQAVPGVQITGPVTIDGQAVVPASETTSGVTTVPQLDMLKWQLMLSSLVTFFLQYLKKARWFTFIDMNSEGANRIAGVVLAFFTALGVGWSFNAETGTLIITGLTAAGLFGFAQEWLTSWVMQQLVYKGAVAPHAAAKQVDAVADKLRVGGDAKGD